MNKSVLIILLVVILLGGFVYVQSQKKSASTIAPTAPVMPTTAVAKPTTASAAGSAMQKENSAVKEFTVTGKNFSFTPNTLSVNKGDTVKVTFKNEDGFHDFKLDEFKVATKVIKTEEEETVVFVADKAGSFEYYCSVGNHRAMGMKGTLTVK